jgi:hypothetical protein
MSTRYKQKPEENHCALLLGQRINWQETLYSFIIGCIILVVYDFTGGSDTITKVPVINASQCLVLGHVSTVPHIVYTIQWYRAPRIWATTKGP